MIHAFPDITLEDVGLGLLYLGGGCIGLVAAVFLISIFLELVNPWND